MIEYTPENFLPAFEKVLNTYAHVRLRDKSGKAVVMMHEDEFNALRGNPEPTEREKEILKASMDEEGSVTFKDNAELRAYAEQQSGLTWNELMKLADDTDH